MSESYLPPVSQLLILGLPEYHLWLEFAELGLSAAHVPELIELALDGELRWRVLVSAEVWAPIHAWRALGQLRAVEAASPLTQLFKNVDRYDDDWVLEELPSIFAMIGAATVPVLTDYLADDSNDVLARITATDSLARVGTAPCRCTSAMH